METTAFSPIAPNTSSPLRGALVGAGNISEYHLRAWQEIDDTQIVALVDPDHDRAVERAQQFGIAVDHVYAGLDSLILAESVDFVDVATPPHIHLDNVLTAASHGVNVLCQKPLATSMTEAWRMVDACEVAGVRCVVNENWRWRSWYREIKRLLDSNTIGTPSHARFCYHGDDVLPQPDGRLPELLVNQPYLAKMPNLILLDWGIHLIDVMRYLFGPIRQVSASTDRQSPLVKGEDTAIVDLHFESGMTGVIDISWAVPIPETRRRARGSVEPLVIQGAKGVLELDPFQDDALIVTNHEGEQKIHAARGERSRDEAYQDSFRHAQEHFVECLRSGRNAENEVRDNLHTLAATQTAYLAAERNEVCELNLYEQPTPVAKI